MRRPARCAATSDGVAAPRRGRLPEDGSAHERAWAHQVAHGGAHVDRVEQPGAGGKKFEEAQRRTLSVVAGQDDLELEIVVK